MAMVVLTPLLLILPILLLKLLYDNLSCYWFTPLRIKKIMEMQGVRGPKPSFFTGNILDMASLVSKTTSQDMKTISHDIVGRKRFLYWNGTEPRLCLTETELIKEFLSKYSTVSGKSWQQRQGSKNFIGQGLLMANGEDWYHQRHIVAPAFMGDRLKSYAAHMVECTKEMLQSLKIASECGQTEVEIGHYMTKLTADIISRTEFGTSYQKGKKIFHLLTLLQSRCAQASRHLCFPGSSNSYGNDLLGMLLNEMQKKKGNGNSINLQLVMDQCKTFFFAGHETTALLLTWTVMLLASNTSWQDKVREEVRTVCNGEIPSLDHLSKLTLLHMVINESLRLYPPASVLPRMVFEDIVLGDLYIPKGLSIWIPVLAIHHSEKLWGKDANEFNPERFSSKSFVPGRFLPFASGPRNCVGQAFALMEAKIILAMLISRFSFTISENYRHAPVVVLTIKPKYGVQVCLTPLEP
ncbi:hypothetical protein LR48_Vigan549s005800 [Vigna angularis]|uniref:Cytokinin hydroxylase n=1 Tax=Phaseolus angularis TaxID=3914 RepID=A0A0L9TDA9_PHAAN|nr:hypothetical protein LR48_Vigan549s005800 [Vigna angularis]